MPKSGRHCIPCAPSTICDELLRRVASSLTILTDQRIRNQLVKIIHIATCVCIAISYLGISFHPMNNSHILKEWPLVKVICGIFAGARELVHRCENSTQERDNGMVPILVE